MSAVELKRAASSYKASTEVGAAFVRKCRLDLNKELCGDISLLVQKGEQC